MRRRTLLKAISAAGMAGLTGCSAGTQEIEGLTNIPWTQLPGPPGGPVTDIAVSKANTDWLYSTSKTAGVYVSSDGGRQWVQGLQRMHHLNCVWPSPHDPNLAYVNGARTPDGGQHWYGTNEVSERRFPPVRPVWNVYEMEWSSEERNTIYAATEEGFYHSFNDGADWERSSIDGRHPPVEFIEGHPETNGLITAVTRNHGIVRSDDHGDSWSLLPGSDTMPEQNINGHILRKPGSAAIYIALNAYGVYRFLDGDIEQITDELVFPWWTNQLRLSADGDRLYFIAARRSENEFENWWDRRELFVYDIPSDALSTVTLPEKPSAVATHPDDPSTIFFGGIRWVWKSTDRGQEWTALSNDYFDRYLATVGINDSNPGTVIAGSVCSTGLSVSGDSGNSWSWKRSGLEPFHDGEFNEHYVMQIAANGEQAYVTTAAGLLISEDNGDSWRLLENEFSGTGEGHGSGNAKHLHGLAVHPEDPLTVFVGTGLGDAGSHRDYFDGESFIWKTEDGGETWREITAGYPSDRDTTIQDIVVSRHDPNVVYAGTNHEDYISGGKRDGAGAGLGLYRSMNAGEQWNRVQVPFQNIHSLTEHPEDAEILLASTPNGVYRTADSGESWEEVLSFETRALLSHPGKSGVIFSGSHVDSKYWDVLVSEDDGETWGEGNLTIQVGASDGDREYDAAELHSDYATTRGDIMWFAFDESNELLYAATNGVGLWRADVSGIG